MAPIQMNVLPQESIRRGFAAGCEAGLCPAGAVYLEVGVGLCPWYGLSPNQGHSPSVSSVSTAGQSSASHRAAKPEQSDCPAVTRDL